MNREMKQSIVNVITDALEHSETVWESKEQSHAYIIGYLQGALKIIKEELGQINK